MIPLFGESEKLDSAVGERGEISQPALVVNKEGTVLYSTTFVISPCRTFFGVRESVLRRRGERSYHPVFFSDCAACVIFTHPHCATWSCTLTKKRNLQWCILQLLPCKTSPGAPLSNKIWTTFSGLMEALVFFPPNQLLVMTNSSQSFHWERLARASKLTHVN